MVSFQAASTTEVDKDRERPNVEIRVHGIGDHDYWSNLGSPRFIRGGTDSDPSVALPPRLPRHAVYLINWSRASRTIAGWLWYLAFPFTLVNLSGMMRDREAVPLARVWHKFCVNFTALVLTACTYMWLVFAAERICVYFGVPYDLRLGRLVALIIGVTLILGAAWRKWSRELSELSGWVVVVHGIAVVAVGVLIVVLQPAQLKIQLENLDYEWLVLFSGFLAVNRSRELWFDPMAFMMWSSLAIVVILSMVLAVLARASRSAPLLATTLLLPLAVILLHLEGAAVVKIAFWLSRAFITTIDDFALERQFVDELRWIDEGLLVTPAGSALAFTTFPLLTAVILLLAAAALFVKRGVFRRELAKAKGLHQPDVTKARAVHRIVIQLPALLPSLVAYNLILLAASLVLPLIFARVTLSNSSIIFGVSTTMHRAIQSAFLFSNISIIAIAALIILGSRMEDTRKGFATFADIAAFWPVTLHPLGGASYRHRVQTVIDEAITIERSGTTVLVGHSQGSVLCAWTISQLPATKLQHRNVVLVTCGSPLDSLYARFFPDFFDATFFEDVAKKTSAWGNFWRETDPIATPLPLAQRIQDFALEDPDSEGRLLKHGNYWGTPEQQDFVSAQIRGDAGKSPVEPEARGES